MTNPDHAPPETLPDQAAQAVQVARLYFYQGLTTGQIAAELGVSRPKVSRLLTLAKQSGLVEIRIHDPAEHPQVLEAQLRQRFPDLSPHVVDVPTGSSEAVSLERVSAYSANLLSNTLQPQQIVGLAWGNTLEAVSRALKPRAIPELTFVQLNGSANAEDFMSGFVTDTVARFARNYGGRAQLFPVPTFFDSAETKKMMWQERSVRHVLALQERADVLLYSLGSTEAEMPSYVYTAGYLEAHEEAGLISAGVVGDLATVFFRADGSFEGIPMNARASGPDLGLVRAAPQTICVVAGVGKARALHAALLGGLAKVLVVDEPTARAVLALG
ncbi:sugar-binding transcriptional regulator [Deinococcus detaillensis]|uniref:Sugar-binding transcriptional regulator n=1 Tax=Deinococcus detaillensis TaxID=2592048 RepID=A0A553UQS9_9DEIO|nr:sugar-binding transcriptional regulator [Deinococcus detaillensis]TSA82568.1 sugar-binding transcriptional regulator [Deinococcus detaillensis]